MPDKMSKVHQETLKFKRYSGPFGCHTCANQRFLVSKVPRGSCLVYIFVLYVPDDGLYYCNAPKPLHLRTALLLGHIRYILFSPDSVFRLTLFGTGRNRSLLLSGLCSKALANWVSTIYLSSLWQFLPMFMVLQMVFLVQYICMGLVSLLYIWGHADLYSLKWDCQFCAQNTSRKFDPTSFCRVIHVQSNQLYLNILPTTLSPNQCSECPLSSVIEQLPYVLICCLQSIENLHLSRI